MTIYLLDVSQKLPKNSKLVWSKRQAPLERIYVHHSGANGRPGYAGVEASARYCSRSKLLGGRGWAGLPYHIWVPYNDLIADDGRRVAFLCNELDRHTWHTGGKANAHGIGVCLQGNLTKTGPSAHQRMVLPDLLSFLKDKLLVGTTDPISTHSRSKKYGGSGKPTCPSKATERWLDDLLASGTL